LENTSCQYLVFYLSDELFCHVDNSRAIVHQHCKQLLLNLLVVLSCHGDHLSVARQGSLLIKARLRKLKILKICVVNSVLIRIRKCENALQKNALDGLNAFLKHVFKIKKCGKESTQ
jgi:hypothetical protein